ncbi:MAG: hypothetical protein D6748_14555 [Calditrichaeota bacterium]|nr:MAG: hypothetical protein D6748_14555 [Calditrichota bacterium]
MSEKNENMGLPEGAGAVEAIRNIIFGEREQFYQKQLKALESQINELKRNLEEQTSALRKEMNEQKKSFSQSLKKLEEGLENRSVGIEHLINSITNELEERLRKVEGVKLDRAALAEQLEALASQLRNE